MISEEERKKYVEFMYNPENEYNCDKCTIISKMQKLHILHKSCITCKSHFIL